MHIYIYIYIYIYHTFFYELLPIIRLTSSSYTLTCVKECLSISNFVLSSGPSHCMANEPGNLIHHKDINITLNHWYTQHMKHARTHAHTHTHARTSLRHEEPMLPSVKVSSHSSLNNGHDIYFRCDIRCFGQYMACDVIGRDCNDCNFYGNKAFDNNCHCYYLSIDFCNCDILGNDCTSACCD